MQAKNDNDWQRTVTRNAGYVCQVCGRDYNFPCYFQGEVNQMTCGHHLQGKKAFPEFRLTIENGLCVDLQCHNNIHNGTIKLN